MVDYYKKYKKYHSRYKNIKLSAGSGLGNVNIVYQLTLNELLLNNNIPEVCGIINEPNLLIIDSIGDWEIEEDSLRGVCKYSRYSKYIWHTHPISTKFYPSPEDIRKVINNDVITDSYIFTPFGYWIIKYNAGQIVVTDIIMGNIDKIANKCFYFATNTAYNLGHTDEVANHMMLKNNKYKKLSCNVNKYILKLQLEIPHLDINFIMSIIPTTDKSDDDNKIIKLVDITV